MVEVNALLLILTGIGMAVLVAGLTWWCLSTGVRRSQRKAMEALHEAATLKRNLNQAQTDLLSVLDETPFLVLLFDRDSHDVTFANKAATGYFGAGNLQENIAQCRLTSGTGDLDTGFDALISDYLQRGQDSNSPVTSSMRQLRIHGQPHWFAISIGYLNVMPGAPVCCVLDDCSRQEAAEQKNAFYRKIIDGIANRDPLELTLREICRYAATFIHGAHCVVHLLDDDGKASRTCSGDHGLVVDLESAGESHGISQVALASQRRVVCEQVQTDERIARALKNRLQSDGFQAWVSDPIVGCKGQVLGLLDLMLPDPVALQAGLTDTLDQLRALSQLAIENARAVSLMRQSEADEAFIRELSDELRFTELSRLMAVLPSALERIGRHLSLGTSELDLWILDNDTNRYRSVNLQGDNAHHRSIPEHRLNSWLENALRERLKRSAPSELRENCYRFSREQSTFRHLLNSLSRHDALGVESIILFPLQSGHRLEGFVTVMEGAAAKLHTLRVVDGLIPLFRDLLSRNRLVEGDADQLQKDSLTGLFNRQKMFEVLSYEAVRAKRYRTKFSVILLDIDGLGQINDQYGYDTGDQVISSVAGLLAASVRSSDVVGRLAGDRYMVLLLETAVPGARKVAKALRAKVGQLEVGAVSGLTVSAGVVGNGEGESGQCLQARAEQFMLKAKRRGRGSIMADGDDSAVSLS
ncbi:MAG: sensor domain-containing diguanylate cyclase [Marinobacter sp.]|uniref:sensor domain-containing diguanylate cyclase n=1 Tax=Marinobacter sp. TaxID=50741 RepID=UPI00299F4741|nr:sensor domain-containing diguanylate cyclase [Marinobacter sp.]MDX1756611.1 sensor domain-containing diguanylate cyclase [Marinobacter sp.]